MTKTQTAPAQHIGATLQQQTSVDVWWRGSLKGKDLSVKLLMVTVNSEENDLKNYEKNTLTVSF